MNKKLLTRGSFIASAVLLASFNALTFSGQAPANANGSPISNGVNCATSCHAGTVATDQSVTITTDIPPTGFLDNTEYTITVSGDKGTSSASTSGFSASVESGSGSEGTLSTGGNSNVTIVSSIFAGHSGKQSFTGNKTEWSFKWNSGSNTPDGATIYAVVNFANNDGGTSGDAAVNQTLQLMKDGSNISIDESALSSIKLYPNPTSEFLRYQNDLEKPIKLQIFDLSGRLALDAPTSTEIENTIDVSQLSKGIYIVHLYSEGKTSVQKIVIQ